MPDGCDVGRGGEEHFAERGVGHGAGRALVLWYGCQQRARANQQPIGRQPRPFRFGCQRE